MHQWQLEKIQMNHNGWHSENISVRKNRNILTVHSFFLPISRDQSHSITRIDKFVVGMNINWGFADFELNIYGFNIVAYKVS